MPVYYQLCPLRTAKEETIGVNSTAHAAFAMRNVNADLYPMTGALPAIDVNKRVSGI